MHAPLRTLNIGRQEPRISAAEVAVERLPRAGGRRARDRQQDRVPAVQAAIALVAAGLGISPVPAAVQRFKTRGVVYRPLRPHTFTEMGLAWRRDDHSALVQRFRRVARETARRTER